MTLVYWYSGAQKDAHEIQDIEAFVDEMGDEARNQVFECEQEILDGGHVEESRENELRVEEEACSQQEWAWNAAYRALNRAVAFGFAFIEFNPPYAVAQRNTFRVYVQKKPE